MVFVIAACHDNGKYIDHKTHEKIAAERFYSNQNFKKFFYPPEFPAFSHFIPVLPHAKGERLILHMKFEAINAKKAFRLYASEGKNPWKR